MAATHKPLTDDLVVPDVLKPCRIPQMTVTESLFLWNLGDWRPFGLSASFDGKRKAARESLEKTELL